jgi:hypothetical protein
MPPVRPPWSEHRMHHRPGRPRCWHPSQHRPSQHQRRPNRRWPRSGERRARRLRSWIGWRHCASWPSGSRMYRAWRSHRRPGARPHADRWCGLRPAVQPGCPQHRQPGWPAHRRRAIGPAACEMPLLAGLRRHHLRIRRQTSHRLPTRRQTPHRLPRRGPRHGPPPTYAGRRCQTGSLPHPAAPLWPTLPTRPPTRTLA